MKDVDQERLWWNERGTTMEAARDAIAADPAAWDGEVLQTSLELILSVLQTAPFPGRVLDLGCGAGRLTIPIAARLGEEAQLVGLDVSQEMLDRAAERAPVKPLRSRPIAWVLGDGRTIPWQVGSLVAAYSMITLQHIPRDAQAGYIRGVAERLVPYGVFRFQVLGGSDDVFLWHCVDEVWIRATCESAGLLVDSVEHRRPLNRTDDDVTALWVTARKP